MITALVVNRRKSYNILSSSPGQSQRGSPRQSQRSSEDTLVDKDEYSSDSDDSIDASKTGLLSPESRRTSQPPYVIAIFNRILQKYPFLVEMFYWALNYVAYQLSKLTASVLYGHVKGNAVTELAQRHGISILHFEHESFFSLFFPIKEVSVQQFFLQNHLGAMTVLNQVYSLVHIPGTVAYVLPA